MKKIDLKFMLLFFGVFIFVLSLCFVLANAIATNVIFNQNASANYDEGGFLFINWTAGASAAGNYTVYLWMDDNFVNGTENANNSATGYYWAVNTTEANYTFTIEAVTAANATGTNASNVSIYIDSSAPLVNWTNSGYNNVTYKKNTNKLIVNVSVGDALSGVASGNSYCVFDINGTNETVAVSGGWCNTTQLNLTGLSDGNHSIDIWANDTVNNVGVNLSYYVVWTDTTAPATPDFSCTPSTVYDGGTVTCSCSGSDASSGINTSYGTSGYSFTQSPSTSSRGTFTLTCDTKDNAGNTASTTTTYTVARNPSVGSSTVGITTWTNTYIVEDSQFKEGFTRELRANQRMRVSVEEVAHHVGIREVTDTTANIEVSSETQTEVLDVGETKMFEVTGDDIYDLSVTLNSIENKNANVTLIYVQEKKISETPEEEQEKEKGEEELAGEEERKNNWWIWVIVIVVLLAIGVGWKKIK